MNKCSITANGWCYEQVCLAECSKLPKMLFDPDYKEGKNINIISISLVRSELMALDLELMRKQNKKYLK